MERFTTSTGVAIAYDHDAAAPSGLPPIVLLHAFALSSDLSWVKSGTADAIADAGRGTLLIDLRGHGESDAPDDAGAYGEARMARDVIELLDHLELERFDLVGVSTGAVVALLVAASDVRVRRLVVSGVGGAAVELGGIDTRELPPQLLAEAMRADDPAGLSHPFAQAWRAFADTIEADRAAIAHQALAMHAEPLPLEHVTAPVLILNAERDNTACDPERLAAALPDARTQVVADTDLLALTREPGYLDAVLAFLGD